MQTLFRSHCVPSQNIHFRCKPLTKQTFETPEKVSFKHLKCDSGPTRVLFRCSHMSSESRGCWVGWRCWWGLLESIGFCRVLHSFAHLWVEILLLNRTRVPEEVAVYGGVSRFCWWGYSCHWDGGAGWRGGASINTDIFSNFQWLLIWKKGWPCCHYPHCQISKVWFLQWSEHNWSKRGHLEVTTWQSHPAWSHTVVDYYFFWRNSSLLENSYN